MRIKPYIVGAAMCLFSGHIAAQRSLEFRVDAETQPNRIRCIGAELDAHFHTNHVPRSEGAQPEDWERIVVPRIEKMQIQSLRVMVLPYWYEPENDNADAATADAAGFCFDSPDMQSLYHILDVAQRMDIPVTIVPWGAGPGSFLSARKDSWIVAPDNHAEYAENISALLRHLIKERKYTCIDELTPGNEPDGWGIDAAEYVSICRALHARLQKDGLLKRVRLNLVDTTDRGGRFDFISGCLPALEGIADVVNSHTYLFGYETPSNLIMEWEAENCRLAAASGLRHCIGEFGSNQTVGSSRQKDIDTYRRGVFIVRSAISYLAAGAYNLSYWQLFDQYYWREDSYQSMQQLGMWKSVKADYATEAYHDDITTDYEVRPQYYAFSLLTRFVRPGARVYRMDADGELSLTNALCVRNKDRSRVYIVANQEPEPLQVTLRNEQHRLRGTYERYVYTEGQLPQGDAMIQPQPDRFRAADGEIRETIPANSVVLYRFK